MRRLGRYEILEELGKGGMGIVYAALDASLARTVAIKTIRFTEYSTPEGTQSLQTRLIREARAAGTLSHPNIVAVHDIGQEGDVDYIVMEFVKGRTLEQALQEKQLGREETLRILADSARALDYAHSHGIIHRDVKPANIMIRDDGIVKLADFGIAKIISAQTMTETGIAVGSPHYLSPEQLKAEGVGGRSDQFSLAAVAYHLLTGRKPFEADTLPSLFARILFEEAVPPQRLNPTLGVEVESVLRRAMSKDPAGRFESCTEFVEALRAACSTTAPAVREPSRAAVRKLSAGTSGTDRSEAPAVAVTLFRSKWFLAAVTVVLLLALAGASWLIRARQQETRRWEAIRDSRNPAQLEAFLKEFPQGRFAPEVRLKLEALKALPQPAPPKIGSPELPAEGAKPERSQAAAAGQRQRAPSAVESTPEAIRPKPKPVETRVNQADGLKYVWIPPGDCQMGCSPGDRQCDPDEKPAHPVTFSKGFWMGQTEVTVQGYQRFALKMGRDMPPAPGFNRDWQEARQPMVNINWDEAEAFCEWAGGRLPSEAEWEYAARAGSQAAFYGNPRDIAWYEDNSGDKAHPVGQRAPNAFGLYDMLGNVREWCRDSYGPYTASAIRDPSGSISGDERVMRGGAFQVRQLALRVTFRFKAPNESRDHDFGFRCTLPAAPR